MLLYPVALSGCFDVMSGMGGLQGLRNYGFLHIFKIRGDPVNPLTRGDPVNPLTRGDPVNPLTTFLSVAFKI